MIKIKKYLPIFITYWIVNAILLYFAASFYPAYFTLGNFRFSAFTAAVVAGFIWTTITFLAKPAICKLGVKLEGREMMFVFYWLANFAGLWITARLAPISGFGTSRFIWIAGLAVVADLIQYGIWKIARM